VSILTKKSILVTGGTGSIGTALVKKAIIDKAKLIRIFSNDENGLYEMESEYGNHKNIEYVIGDIQNEETVSEIVKEIDIIFHAAALKQVPAVESHPYEAVKTNIFGAYNVVKAVVERKVKNVVAISTDKAVKPVNAMGMTKALQEKIILSDDLTKDGTKFCCVRYGNVLGSRGSVIPLWNSKIEQNKPLPVTHPDMTRFLLTLSQAIDLVFYSLMHGRGREIFVKKAPGAKMVDLAKAYAELKTGKKNYPLEYVGIRAGEKIDEILVSFEEMRHAQERKDHFVINRENDFDTGSLKKSIKIMEYGSGTANHLGILELKEMMKKLKWVL